MYTIIELTTGRALFSKSDDETLEGQTATEKVCMIDNPDGKEIYFNFETQEFYLTE